VPADGAVPGASPALTSLAAARAATTVLPHSPQLLAALAGKVPAAPAAASAAAPKTLGGLDVAAFQHPNGKGIAWRSVAAAHYTFAAVKATEGNYYVSPYAASDLAGARAAGLDATPYHFAIPNASDGATQARFAVQHSGYRSGARLLPLMLDIEYDPYVNTDRTNECYGLSAASMRTWLSAFVSTAKSLTGQFPLIYTTADWWNTCTGRSTAFAADPMWVAAYGTSSPPLPAGWKSWTFWQYSSGGTVPGVYAAGATDVDRFTPTAVGLINPGTETLRRGKLASLTISSLGKLAGEKLTYAAAGLPPGVTLRAGGVLAGTVAKSASKATVTYHVTVSARNASGGTGSVVFSWNVAPA
jgi:GH25 family lysozyme M1 (1,4-beta-N-acetylmuramidase)